VCLDGVVVDLIWRLFSNPGIYVVGDASPKHREMRSYEVFGNDKSCNSFVGIIKTGSAVGAVAALGSRGQ
jgi:hypothetical protein